MAITSLKIGHFHPDFGQLRWPFLATIVLSGGGHGSGQLLWPPRISRHAVSNATLDKDTLTKAPGTAQMTTSKSTVTFFWNGRIVPVHVFYCRILASRRLQKPSVHRMLSLIGPKNKPVFGVFKIDLVGRGQMSNFARKWGDQRKNPFILLRPAIITTTRYYQNNHRTRVGPSARLERTYLFMTPTLNKTCSAWKFPIFSLEMLISPIFGD